ncbi:MAG: L,D-transpeptidase [Actinobacteria bacterium]|nr:L,D-transpeptidase [Actinomycetota bacterium]
MPALPRDDHHGRRIVYDKALMTVWVMSERDEVLGRYPVVGRFDRPAKGVYRIFSKSKVANNPNSKVTFNHMMRFTYGPDTKSPIGLHAIPRYYDGTAMHSTKQLGLAIAAGGCVRLSEEAAAAIYKWAKVGDRVIVLPSP